MNEDIVEVEGPDGNIYEFPAGTTQDQALAFFKRTQPPAPAVPASESIKKGMSDPYSAAAQVFSKIIPESAINAIQGVSKLTPGATLTGMLPQGVQNFLRELSPEMTPGAAEQIAAKEREYTARREAAGQTGFDWGRLGGNILSPINLAAGAGTSGLPLYGRIASAAGQGAIAQPLSNTDEFAEQKGKQAVIGALGGMGGELAGRTLGRVISPAASRDKQVQMLMEEGITPTMGHLLGPKATAVERALHITPVMGTTIGAAEKRTFEDFNRAVANRIVRNVGEKLPKDVDVGTDLFAKTNQILSDKYDELLPKLKGAIDTPLQSDLNQLRAMAKSLPKEQEETFNRILKNDLEDRFTTSGLARGETLKEVESLLGKTARDYRSASDPDKRKVGDAILEAQRAFKAMIERQNPQYTEQLQKINEGWAGLIRMEKATAAAGAQRRGGVFTPEEYLAAVKSADTSLRKRRVAKGEAYDQEFAQAAQRVLGKEPQSLGQAYRIAAGLGLGGAYSTNPALMLGEALGSMPYSPVGQRAIASALGRRPQAAAGLREFVRSNIPMTYSGVTSALQQYRDANPEQVYRRLTEGD